MTTFGNIFGAAQTTVIHQAYPNTFTADATPGAKVQRGTVYFECPAFRGMLAVEVAGEDDVQAYAVDIPATLSPSAMREKLNTGWTPTQRGVAVPIITKTNSKIGWKNTLLKLLESPAAVGISVQ